MELLRFITCGNVDDGKSTLIGRLLHDSKSIMEDQLEAMRDASARRGDDTLNLALLTDGLRAEREQGITIDVAYRYFATPKRKFIIADCPGHFQYTRNMVTGASNANLAIVLVDARKGLTEQTRRHSFVVSLLRTPHIVVCVNKMDLVEYSQQIFEDIRRDFGQFSKKLDVYDVTFIPVSALNGDNIVEPSAHMPWYQGRPLLGHLEEVHVASDVNYVDFRFPVQSVIAPLSDDVQDYRGFAGAVVSGNVKTGDEVVALPSGFVSRIRSIERGETKLNEATALESVTIRLEKEIDLSRGDMFCRANNRPTISQDLDATICWMDSEMLNLSKRYLLRQTTSEVQALFKEIAYKFDINSLSRISDDKKVGLNDFAKVKLRTGKPVLYDPYRVNRATGGFVIVDPDTGATMAAGMLL